MKKRKTLKKHNTSEVKTGSAFRDACNSLEFKSVSNTSYGRLPAEKVFMAAHDNQDGAGVWTNWLKGVNDLAKQNHTTYKPKMSKEYCTVCSSPAVIVDQKRISHS